MGRKIGGICLVLLLSLTITYLAYAEPVVASFPTAASTETNFPTQTLSSGHRLVLVGYHVYLYSPSGTLMAQGDLTSIAPQLYDMDPALLVGFTDYMLETLVFLESEILSIGELQEMILSLVSDLAVPTFDADIHQGSFPIYIGAFSLDNGDPIHIYEIYGNHGPVGVLRINGNTGEARFDPIDLGGQQTRSGFDDPKGGPAGGPSGSEDGTKGQGSGSGGGDDDDGIFIPPPTQGSGEGGTGGGGYGDGKTAGGNIAGQIQDLSTVIIREKFRMDGSDTNPSF